MRLHAFVIAHFPVWPKRPDFNRLTRTHKHGESTASSYRYTVRGAICIASELFGVSRRCSPDMLLSQTKNHLVRQASSLFLLWCHDRFTLPDSTPRGRQLMRLALSNLVIVEFLFTFSSQNHRLISYHYAAHASKSFFSYSHPNTC